MKTDKPPKGVADFNLSSAKLRILGSTILRKLAAYPRQNGLATAMRESGRLERTTFTLDFLRDIRVASAHSSRP
jgi:TnpA family transposase